jgi:hypothetical protein
MMLLPPDELAALPGKGMLKPGTLVLELGNKKNVHGLYRNWYTDQGLEYVCLDWNGEDDAVPLDMRYALVPDDVENGMEGGFALVTNFGFSEHVDNQMACWSNIHGFVGHEGYLSICMPLMPWWKGHGLWMPTEAWYSVFAALNGYEILHSQVWDRVRPTYVALMKKTGTCDVFEMPVGLIESSGGKK